MKTTMGEEATISLALSSAMGGLLGSPGLELEREDDCVIPMPSPVRPFYTQEYKTTSEGRLFCCGRRIGRRRRDFIAALCRVGASCALSHSHCLVHLVCIGQFHNSRYILHHFRALARMCMGQFHEFNVRTGHFCLVLFWSRLRLSMHVTLRRRRIPAFQN